MALHPHTEYHSSPYRIYYRRFLASRFHHSLTCIQAFDILGEEVAASTPEGVPSPSSTPTPRQEENKAVASDEITIEYVSPIPTTEYAAGTVASIVVASLHVSAPPKNLLLHQRPHPHPSKKASTTSSKTLASTAPSPPPTQTQKPPPPAPNRPDEAPLAPENQLPLTTARCKDFTELIALATSHLSSLCELSKLSKDGKGIGAEVEGGVA